MLGCLGGGFEEQHVFFLGKVDCALGGDHLVLAHVGLVAHQDQQGAWVRVVLDLVQPEVLDAFEALQVGDVVDQDDRVCACVRGSLLL